MGLFDFFDPKKKDIAVETENDLPSFTVDVNGFIMFKDPDLGGCGIFEVEPCVSGMGFTHTDSLQNGMDTESNAYDPQNGDGWKFRDRRHDVVPQWVAFLNGLFPHDESETQTQVQILLKKTRPYEWATRYNYAFNENDAVIGEFYASRGYNSGNSRKARLMRARANDYLGFLKAQSDESSRPSLTMDLNKLDSYAVKMYIVVSHTPSSEGWWIDGRDTDYYMKDESTPDALFKGSDFVDRIAGMLTKRSVQSMYDNGNNTANDLFPFESDITAQIIETRMRRIEQNLANIYEKTPPNDRAFFIRRLEPKESAGLVKFFPNVLTPYFAKAMDVLHENINDIYYGFDTENASMTGDSGYMSRVAKDIIYGNVDLSLSDEEENEFLDKYRSMTWEEAEGTIDDVYASEKDKLSAFNDAAQSIADREYYGDEDDEPDELDDMWRDMGGFTINTTSDEDEETLRREYLKRQGRKSLTVANTLENKRLREERLQSHDASGEYNQERIDALASDGENRASRRRRLNRDNPGAVARKRVIKNGGDGNGAARRNGAKNVRQIEPRKR